MTAQNKPHAAPPDESSAAGPHSERAPSRRRLAGEPMPGATPGTLLISDGPRPTMYVMDYCQTSLHERALDSIDDAVTYLEDQTPSITWIDVRGIRNRETFERLGQIFKLHPLALEDMVNVPQRPHADVYPEQQLIVARMMRREPLEGLRTEQIAIVFGEGYVLTVQEEDRHDCLDPVRARIRSGRGSLRKSGADYLAYVILDAIVDGFYPVLEAVGDQLEELETAASEVRTNASHEIHVMKRALLAARRTVWPTRDVVSALMRDDSPHVAESTRPFLRDTYDHTVQAMDMVETFREIASGLMDLYFSGVSNRTNEIMKVLTIISTVFIPLTFIAGVYGMNFDTKVSPYNMPELESPYGYPLTLIAMALCTLALLYFYRRKGWLGRS